MLFNTQFIKQERRRRKKVSTLIEPHGGVLKERILPAAEAEALKARAMDMVSWDLTERQIWDLEMLLNGGFSPLEGFLGKADYESVLKDMRLSDKTIWPMPITLDVTEEFAGNVKEGDEVALRDAEGVLLAVLTVTDKWTPDKKKEAKSVFNTIDTVHPGVNYLFNRAHPVYLGGPLSGVEFPRHYDFKELRNTPRELREKFKRSGWRRVVAFQTRNPMHRAHQEITFRAAQQTEASLSLSGALYRLEPPASGHEDGRAERGGLALDHKEELRMHPLHSRKEPRRPRKGQQGQ
jgi:sulfate adenylyltransferase